MGGLTVGDFEWKLVMIVVTSVIPNVWALLMDRREKTDIIGGKLNTNFNFFERPCGSTLDLDR